MNSARKGTFFSGLIPFKLNPTEGGQFDWDGRIGRRQYFSRTIVIAFSLLVPGSIVAAFLKTIEGRSPYNNPLQSHPADAVMNATSILIDICILPIAAKRLHDMGVGGEYALLAFLPFVMSHLHPMPILYLVPMLLNLILYVWPGTKNENKYGKNPRI